MTLGIVQYTRTALQVFKTLLKSTKRGGGQASKKRTRTQQSVSQSESSLENARAPDQSLPGPPPPLRDALLLGQQHQEVQGPQGGRQRAEGLNGKGAEVIKIPLRIRISHLKLFYFKVP